MRYRTGLAEEIGFEVFERPMATAAATFDAGPSGNPQGADEGPVAVISSRSDMNAGQPSLTNPRAVLEASAPDSEQSREEQPPASPQGATPFRRQLDLLV